ncbi:hypothetical protein Tco_1370857 [Tanacetum coccineum]
MVFSVSSHKEEGSSSTPTPPILIFDLPEEIVETIGDLTFEKRAKLCYKTFLTILLKNHGLCIKGLKFHPDYPILNIFHIHDLWRLGSFLPPRAVNDDGSVMYHALYYFIHDWYKDNPSSRRCERKLRTLFADTRSLMARANGVDPDKIPYYVMWNISVLKRRYEKGDPTVGLLGEPPGKFDYYVVYPKAEPSQPLSPPHKTLPSPHKPPPTSPPPPPKLSPYNQKALSILHQDSPLFLITKDPSCSYLQEYEQEFPALTAFEHLDSRTNHDWKIKTQQL